MNTKKDKKTLKQAQQPQAETQGRTEELRHDLRSRKKKQPKKKSQMLGRQTPNPSKPSKSYYQKIGYLKPEYHPNTFQMEYKHFKKTQIKDQNTLEYELSDIKFFEDFFQLVAQEGGTIQILSKGSWYEVCQRLRRVYNQLKNIEDDQLLQIYMDKIFEYQMQKVGTPLKFKKDVCLEQTLRNALFIHEGDRNFLYCLQAQANLFNQQIVVIQNAAQTLDLQGINLQRLEEECGDEELPLRIQNPMAYGFNPNKMTNLEDKMTISQYLEYQKHYQDQSYCIKKFGRKLSGGKVFFGVNFVPRGGTIIEEMREKLMNTLFGWARPDDVLSLMDKHVEGCSLPQFYLKVKGVWTGGHQENINMCSININHGPQDSQWYTIPFEDVQKLREVLYSHYKRDLYQQEGVLFQKLNWFIQRGFKIKRILQKAGDMVISGPGTLHWVRALGPSMHSAWNIFPGTYKMFLSASHRQRQNKQIKFPQSNIIPFKSLTLKQLQHNLLIMTREQVFFLKLLLTNWLDDQKSQLFRLITRYPNTKIIVQQRKIKERLAFCKSCFQQILTFYCEDDETDQIICLFCIEQSLAKKKNQTVYYRMEPKELQQFLDASKPKGDEVKPSKPKLDKDPDQFFSCCRSHIGGCLKTKLQDIHKTACLKQACIYCRVNLIGKQIKFTRLQVIRRQPVEIDRIAQELCQQAPPYFLQQLQQLSQKRSRPQMTPPEIEQQLRRLKDDKQETLIQSKLKKKKDSKMKEKTAVQEKKQSQRPKQSIQKRGRTTRDKQKLQNQKVIDILPNVEKDHRQDTANTLKQDTIIIEDLDQEGNNQKQVVDQQITQRSHEKPNISTEKSEQQKPKILIAKKSSKKTLNKSSGQN